MSSSTKNKPSFIMVKVDAGLITLHRV